ncbi:hypothetical protein QQX98_002352 [Neonectria punicea]|uniref:beta-galactosidase n=1 Tax=Neonectria punicea TaxID=979145 RepID=A0ABR1HJQ4_9HYPO
MDVTTSLENPDWNNLEVIHHNTLPPRSSFWNFTSVDNALTRDPKKAPAHSLSGTWKFKVYECPSDMPMASAKELQASKEYCDIAVPGMWQLQGHGQGPRYTNMSLPFPVDPPNVPLFENETGYYIREFEVPTAFADNQLRLRFEGVDAAFHVSMNGQEIGYSQGSRNPSEFDISSYVSTKGSNLLSVIVYQRCNGTYLEDQDQWWLSGIFRDVYLLSFPRETRIEDFKIETLLDKDYKNAVLSVDVQVIGSADVALELLDAEMKRVASVSQASSSVTVTFKVDIENPHKWTSETPYLYYAILTLGENQQTICQHVGFRQVEIKDGVITVNGNRVVFRGINRHEHNPKSGRTVPYEFMRNDLVQMKKHNINAIRTAHYPNDPRLYDLADELGFWIMDEADLESHGFSYVELAALTDEDKKLSKKGVISLECGRATEWITNKPEWEASFVDRARHLVSRDKNHPSVVIWSLGNESYHGHNTTACYNWVKANDKTRPIHYEGDREAEVVDMYSLMYPEYHEILELEATSPQKKPILLCEYIYGIGNGAGAIKEYIDLFNEHPHVERFYGYGGDFNDNINDGREMTHGYNFSDHTPKPALAELKKAFEPVQPLSGGLTGFSLINRYNFADLGHLKCEWAIVGDGFRSEPTEIVLPVVKPGDTAQVAIDGLDLDKESRECYLEIVFSLRESTLWASAGHEVAGGQFQLQGPSSKTVTTSVGPSVKNLSDSVIEIQGKPSCWTFDCRRGTLLSWSKNGGENLLTSTPALSFYRPMTDHDEFADGKQWTDKLLKHVRPFTKSVKAEKTGNSVVTTTYIFTTDRMNIAVSGTPFGINTPQTLARTGLEFAVSPSLDRASWFGRGPGEAYADRKLSQRFGNWDAPLESLFTHFEYPQESGNRADVRWVTFDSSKRDVSSSIKADFGTKDGCSFSASYYNALDIDRCRHPYELYKLKRKEPIVRLDWAHHGLGTGAIGPKTLPQYSLLTKPFSFQVALE